MKRVSIFVFIVVYTFFIHSCGEPEGLDISFPYELLTSDPQAAYEEALILKEKSEKSDDLSGLIESNQILAYIHYQNGEYDLAIPRYLEAIHYGETTPQEFFSELTSLHKNCGEIYWRTGSYSLAEEYYTKGIKLANASGDTKQLVSISYNLSYLFRDQGEYQKAIEVLNQVASLAETGSKRYFNILNNIGTYHIRLENYSLATATFRKLMEELPPDQLKLKGYALQNTAKSYRLMDKPEEALEWYQKAIELKRKSGADNPSLFYSFYGIGEAYKMLRQYEKAKEYFHQAERFITEENRLDPDYFELYNDQGDLYHLLEEEKEAYWYKDLYTISFNKRDILRKRTEKAGKPYNMELVTYKFKQDIKQAKLDKQIANMWSWFTWAGVAFLTITLALVYKVHRLRRKVADIRGRVERAMQALGILGNIT